MLSAAFSKNKIWNMGARSHYSDKIKNPLPLSWRVTVNW